MSTMIVPKMTLSVVREKDAETGRVHSLTRAKSGRIYAAADREVMLSDDGGRTFRLAASKPGDRVLYGLSAHDERVYAVGKDGIAVVSDDGGFTWTPLQLEQDHDHDHAHNLFELARGPDGTFWLAGDHGTLLRSKDGLRFSVPETLRDREHAHARYLRVLFEGDGVLVLSSAGEIVRIAGPGEAMLALRAFKGMKTLPFTRKVAVGGAWLVVGDAGAAFRSEDGGATFTRVALPVAADLEDVAVTEQGVFVVGGDGAVLFSPDGKRFVAIPSSFGVHLWSILPLGGGVLLVSGDQGLIARIDVSTTETMNLALGDDANSDVENRFDEEPSGHEEEEDEEDEDGGEEEIATFASLEEASARWKKEGRAFIDALNAYVRRCYEVGPNKAGKEPKETRGDMADYVRRALVRLNAAGEARRARELFPPAYEPFDYDSLGTTIGAVAFLDERRRLVNAGERVYVIEGDAITLVPDVERFGRAPSGDVFAKVYADRIDLHRGWDGPKLRTLPRSGDVEIKQVVPTPEGDAAAVASELGVHWHHEGGVRELLEEASYPHVALSPNGRFLAYGTQDTSHMILDRKTGLEHVFDPVSSYPHCAFFHHDEPKLVLSSCHALYGSGSMVVDVERLSKGKPNAAQILDRRAWVYSGTSAGNRLLLGDGSGYVWAKSTNDGEEGWHVFLGSWIAAMSTSPDGKKLLVGTVAGYVVELDLDAPAPDSSLLTNGPVKEIARWVFWQGHDPMTW